MEEKLTKEKVEELLALEGETRGFNLEQDTKWILKEKGGKGLLKVEKKMEELGCPIKYGEIKKMEFYPVGMRAVSLLAIRDVYGLKNEDIGEICSYHPRVSLVIKLFAKHFFSVEEVAKKAPEMWRRYFTTGEVEIVEHDTEKRKIVGRIKDFELHPAFCVCLEGYFKTAIEMVTGNGDVVVEEVKCTFEGDPYHEYIINY